MPLNPGLSLHAQSEGMNPASIAAVGIAAAAQRYDASAARTAARPLEDLASEIVERAEAKVAVQANAAVLRSADDMTGSLLDILA